MKRLATFIVNHPWRALAAAVAVAVVGGFALAASGIVPVKASAGHWAATEWFLQFSKRRSIATHARFGKEPPPAIDDMSLILRGAGHYETGCRPCHGAPGDPTPRIAAAMLPVPPRLEQRAAERSVKQLFHVIKHGLKFTGMPAWPAQQRDDEVWAVVAFVRRLPSLDARGYAALVRGDGTALTELSPGAGVPAPRVVNELCARCHGADGRGRGVAAFPKLAGQRQEYLVRALRAYAEGQRHSGIMEPIALGLTDTDREAAARYYASLPPLPHSPAQSEAARRGEVIALRGVPEEDIPSCADCHAPAGARVRGAYPRLDGQYAEYLVQQLELLQQHRRGGSDYVRLMRAFVDRLTPRQIEDVAAYFSGLAEVPPPGSRQPME